MEHNSSGTTIDTQLPMATVTDKTLVEQSVKKPSHINHRAWKAHLKKLKRKEKRQAAAKEREKDQGICPSPVTDSEEERERARAEAESQHQHQLWLERERQAQLAFQAKKEWEEKERKRKEEIERKIREEWEERESKERKEQEDKEKREQEKKLKQFSQVKTIKELNGLFSDKLLKEATANENTGAWHNPIAPVQYTKERQVEHCPFFKKTAACRFGDHCSRYHDYPESSCTLLIPNMFSSFELEQSIVDNIDTDVSLEYDDNELYHSFKEFYADVVPEFKKVGTVIQLKVCCNCEPHLRGNVYVQYKRESAAQKAYEIFNARWYGGRQLSCVFVNIESWKAAICGLASKKRCPKGKSCNFLHVFRNPGGEFAEMDYDQKTTNRNDYRNGRHRQCSNHSESHRNRSRSESVRSYSSRRHSRSRSRERRSKVRYRSRSRSPSRISHSSRRRSISKSRSPSRKPRSNRSRSHSPVKTLGSHYKSRSRSRSPRRSYRSGHSRSRNKDAENQHKKARSHSKSPPPSSYHHHDSSFLTSSNHYADRNTQYSLDRPSNADIRSRSGSPHSNVSDPTSPRISKSKQKPSESPTSSSSSSPPSSSEHSDHISKSSKGHKKERKRHHRSSSSKNSSSKRPVTDSGSEMEDEFEYVEKTKETLVRNR